MIIKSSQRAAHMELAAHLVKTNDIDGTPQKVAISGSRDLVSNDNVREALRDMQVLAMTSKRCQKDLYHISMSPSESMDDEAWNLAWQSYEAEFGLSHLPYIEVTHFKEGDRPPHRHRVYERVDVDTGRALQLSHTRIRNEKVARIIEFDLGHPLTIGKHNRTVMAQLEEDERVEIAQWMKDGSADQKDRPAANQNHSEAQMERRTGLTTKQVKADLLECFAEAVDGRSFQKSIGERGYVLAKGERRDYVIIDIAGGIHSPRRRLGVKAKVLSEQWADLDKDNLLSVKEAQALLKQQWAAYLADDADEAKDETAAADSAASDFSSGAEGRGLPDLKRQADALDKEINNIEKQLANTHGAVDEEALNYWQRSQEEPASDSLKPRRGDDNAAAAHLSGRGRNTTSVRIQPLDQRQLITMQGNAAIAERQRRLLALSGSISPAGGKASQSRRLTTSKHSTTAGQGATADKHKLTDSVGMEEYYRAWKERFEGQPKSRALNRSSYRVADRWILQRLARKGYSRQQSRRILMQASPEVMNQRSGERLRYVRRITEKVYGEHERQQHLKQREAEKNKTVRNVTTAGSKQLLEPMGKGSGSDKAEDIKSDSNKLPEHKRPEQTKGKGRSLER